MADLTSGRMSTRERAIWNAVFAAAFVDQTRKAYDVTAQMGKTSLLYGLSFNECALEDTEAHAEVRRSVANAAVYGLRMTRGERSSTIAVELESLAGTKEAVAEHG